MTKILKIFARSLHVLMEIIVLLLIVIVFALRTSPVQTKLADYATTFLSKELNTKIAIEKIDIVFFDKIDLKGILLMNEGQSDTIVSAKSLLVHLNGIASFQKQLHFKSVLLEDAVCKIDRPVGAEFINLRFVIDYFSKNKKKKRGHIPFTFDEAHLKNIRFQFDNYNIPYRKDGGMDYQHLYISEIDLKAHDIKIRSGVITGIVDQLSANEKCGFRLDNFTANYLIVSDHGVELKDVVIKTPYSDIRSEDYKMVYQRYPQFRTFVDSVAFDAVLNPSKTSFTDIAFFAPQLKGMNQKVEVEGKVTKFIKNLKVEDFILKTGVKSRLEGTINLPDFRDLKNAFYQERLDYAYVDLADLQQIKLPERTGKQYIALNENVQRFDHFEATNVRLDGIFSQFVLAADQVTTSIGSVNMDNGVMFTHNPINNSFFFSHSEISEYDVKVNKFNLGKFLNKPTFGEVDGSLLLSGEAFSFTDIHFDKIEGNVNRFDLDGYAYSNILVKNASLVDKVLYAEVDVEDKNLQLNYAGTIDLNGEPKMNMNIDVRKALLGKLNYRSDESSNLIANININTNGVNPNTMSGSGEINEILYVEGNKIIHIPNLNFDIERGATSDHLSIRSSLVNADFDGKMDFNAMNYVLRDQIEQIFPGVFSIKNTKKNHKASDFINSDDCLTFHLNLIDINSILTIFQPQLKVARGTVIDGDYDVNNRYFKFDLNSSEIAYNDIVAKGIVLNQFANENTITASVDFKSLKLNDSIVLADFNFTSAGNGQNLISNLTWNPTTENASDIRWNTQILSKNKFNFSFEPSYFSINKQHWDISKETNVQIDSSSIVVKGLKLSSGEQYILANGKVSKNDNDKLKFELYEIDLKKLSSMIGLNKTLEGKLNGWGSISNPYVNLFYMGDLKVLGLKVNNEDVGDVYVLSQWDKENNVIDLAGDLLFRKIPTFQFHGSYDINKKTDNLDFKLLFNNTDISFANAFLEPLVIGDIKGRVNGTIDVTGSLSRPELNGEVKLDEGSVKVVLLGTTYNLNGVVKADKDGFYIDYIPVSDIDGNTGSLTGSIYHNNYKDWNFDVSIDLEEDYYKRDPNMSWVKLPLNRFLVMDTDGKNGDLYYGKAYATGTVGIFGYLKNLDINVNLKSQRGTWVDLSLFRQTDVKEDNFIEFVSIDTTQQVVEKRIDFSGVSLNLNFDVNPDAQVKMIFNEQTNDQITAFGNGKINLKMDNLGQLSLDGSYSTVEGSKYNFVLGPIKETFYIADGGTITWTGNPYGATLDLNAIYKLRANLGDLSPELLVSGTQEINCLINLSEALMKPAIEFDIKAPKAPDTDRSLLSQLTSDKDELSRQFFSLLLWKKFQPTKGSTRASGGAALDLATNQINSLLSQVSQDYKLNVDMNADDQGRSEYAFGIEKGFLDDKLVISGQFGARNETKGNQTQSSFIGDIELEYKLNKEGTFRINVFNESNDNRNLQINNDKGPFKQGVGIYYKENFNSVKDFKLLQKFFDIFRKKENKRYPIRRKKEQTPVPKDEDDE
ncbi:MAG: translocation/assembly module TamB [Crocinitomicaceae bacterium]|nr:translocation/assembly module TamB [Crocinitomicaceae bacterium]